MPMRTGAIKGVAILLPVFLAAGCGSGGKPVSSRSDSHSAVALTIYSTANPAEFDPQTVFAEANMGYRPAPGYGVVRDTRQFTLNKGINRVEVTDIAAGIDPTTVAFRSLTDPSGAAVLEQNLENDLANPETVLRRYLDKEVVVRIAEKGGEATEMRGVLLSPAMANGYNTAAYVLRTGGKDGAVTILDASRVVSITLANTGGRVVSKPTLTWLIDSQRTGTQDVEIAYQTDGITWRADYGLLLSPDEKNADLSAWVSVVNASGLTYPDAKLKLVAGRVRRLDPQRYQPQPGGGGGGLFGGSRKESFEEKEFFDYHLYTLSRTTTLPERSTKQIELFPERTKVPVEKAYMWLGPAKERNSAYAPEVEQNFNSDDKGAIEILVSLKNSREQGLGIPLPAGRVRLYKRDPADRTREFIGEDVIDHTPVDEPLLLRVGSAFDIVGSREQTKFEREDHMITEAFTVSIRNRKKVPVQVTVREFMYRWVNWKILESSEKWTPVGVKAINFKLDLAAGEERKVSYTVKYTW